MPSAIVGITQQFTKPYLTLTEFKNAPTALDYNNLVPGGNAAAQDAELTNVIFRASSYIDQYCSQTLAARTTVEQQRVRVSGDGTLRIHPQNWPVVALTALEFGGTPNSMNPVPDCSLAWLEDQSIIFPAGGSSLTYSSQGPLSLGYGINYGAVQYAKYTYVNGYPTDVTTAFASAGATSFVVSDPAGIIAGQQLRIYDSANTENVTVSNSYVLGTPTITLQAPLAFSHNIGTGVSGLPSAIKEACILLTSAYLKMRGDASLTLSITNIADQAVPGNNAQVNSLVGAAQDLLKPFRRIR